VLEFGFVKPKEKNMKDDYSTVFRNLKADRTTGRYSPPRRVIPDPAWMMWTGGIAMGIVLAVLLFWGIP